MPKSQDGWVEAVRQLYVARRLAVATSTSCVACAKSMLTTAPSALRERFSVSANLKLTTFANASRRMR